jgi:hypothetical protein
LVVNCAIKIIVGSSKVDEFKSYKAYFTITWSIVGIREIGGPQIS